MSPSSEFAITQALPTDFPSIAQIEDLAFSISPKTDLLFGAYDPSDPSAPKSTAHSANRHLNTSLADPTSKYMIATHVESGEVVGIAKWNFNLSEDGKESFPWPEANEGNYPKPANLKMLGWFFGGLDGVRNGWMKNRGGEKGVERHHLMAILAVRPGWQRRGIGKLLLEWGLDRADEEGTWVWIDASPQGKGLYEKMGWKQVGSVVCDLGDWGGNKGDISTTVCMVREPQTKGTK